MVTEPWPMSRKERQPIMTEEKKIVFIECERCGTSVDSDHAQHVETSSGEYDLCDNCVEILEARAESV